MWMLPIAARAIDQQTEDVKVNVGIKEELAPAKRKRTRDVTPHKVTLHELVCQKLR